MSDFYGENNALYEFIKINSPDNFAFYENTLSLMLVVDYRTLDVKFVLLDDRSGTSLLPQYKSTCAKIAKEFCNTLNVPGVWVNYDDSNELKNDSNVGIAIYNKSIGSWTKHNCEIQNIKNLLDKQGVHIEIRTSPKFVSKAFNSKPSSNFHMWQRDYMDTNGFIIDIDLVRYDTKNNKILAIYELKRSYTSFVSWLPYDADKQNYYATSKLCEALKIRFDVLFNHQDKAKDGSVTDDLSMIKVFNVFHKIGRPYNEQNTLLVVLTTIEDPESFVDNNKTQALKDNPFYPPFRSL